MERNVKQIGLVNLLVMLVVGVASFALARYANALSGQIGSVFFGLGVLVLVVSYFQMRLEETERLERMEFDELTRAKGSSSLFSAGEAEAFPARRSREQFERFFVPSFTVALFLLQVGALYWCWTSLRNTAVVEMQKPTVAMSLFALFALALFLLGKYSAGIARLRNDRLVRPGASYLLLGAYLSFIVAASIAAVQAGFSRIDLYAAWVFSGLLALCAVESVINLVLEIYRPRLKGGAPRLLYDSRLIGLLGQPEGIFATAAHALDYQFGFKVSETWFYRFLQKAFAWLVLFQLGALALSTCFVFIAPGEEGVVERWGQPVAGRAVLGPGLHLKWPYPIDRVYRARTDQIQQFVVGSHEESERPRTIVWTTPHEEEPFNLLVASRQRVSSRGTNNPAGEPGAPVDLLTVGIPVQYQISDIRAWTYHYTEADELLEQIATREVIRYFVNVDLFDLMSVSREKAAQDLLRQIQTKIDTLEPKLGAKILFVGLQDVHPPLGKGRTEVARKFEEVVGATQEVEAMLRKAEGDAASLLPKARAEAERIVREADAYKIRRIASARAEAAVFTNRLAAFQAAPQVFKARAYLEAFLRGSTNSRKYVLTTPRRAVIQVDLQDTIASGLLKATAPLPKESEE